MTLLQLQSILLWSALINYVALLLGFAFFAGAREWMHCLHRRWFGLSNETMDAIVYGLLGGYKLAIWMFLIGPGLGVWLVRQVG